MDAVEGPVPVPVPFPVPVEEPLPVPVPVELVPTAEILVPDATMAYEPLRLLAAHNEE